jgi:hypothetical protein
MAGFSRKFRAGLIVGTAALLLVLAMAASAQAASKLPDLALARGGPSTVYAGATFSEAITVTNKGKGTAAGVVVDYYPALTLTPTSAGLSCAGIYKGHSGRGGGYTLVGWACTQTLKKGLKPKKSVTLSFSIKAPAAGTLNETFNTEPVPNEGQLNLVSHSGGDSITVAQPPAPEAPTEVHAAQVEDQLQVGWTLAPATAEAITSSTITLTPTDGSSAPVVTATASPTGGQAGPVEPLTRYEITVVNKDASGSSPASSPIYFTTPAATVPPSAPTELKAWWIANNPPTGSFAVRWTAGAPGSSAIDEFEVKAVPAEPEVASTLYNIEPASSGETVFTGNSETPWSASVRAHNAAGWGPWSAPVELGGL